MDMIPTTNYAKLCGVMAAKPVYSHSSRGQQFYTFPLEVLRLSGNCDTLNIIARPEQLAEVEAADAVKNGADEIDMVINLSMVKDGCWDAVAKDISAVREATRGHILKVIIECCLLTDEEKVKMCKIVSDCGADYIKTSTGFSKGGATREDVKLMRENCPASVKVKAAGGISSIQDAEDFVALGADRLGTSRIVKLAIEQEKAETAAEAKGEDAAY